MATQPSPEIPMNSPIDVPLSTPMDPIPMTPNDPGVTDPVPEPGYE